MFPCEIKPEAARHTLWVRFHAPVNQLAARFGEIYGAIGQYLSELGEEPVGPAYATYYNMDMDNLDVEAGFVVAKPLVGRSDIKPGLVEAGTYAICHYTGPYDGVSTAYEQLTQFVAEQGYLPSGIAYEWYFDGPETPPDEARTDVAFPVTPVEESAPLPH